jgi:iron(III) transport system ATP-binding protein
VSHPFAEISHVFKSFGKTRVLNDVSLSAAGGEVIAVLGSSGSGKTTLLRCIAGLETADSGEARIGDKVLFSGRVSLRPQERPVSLLFQDFALFPHLSAMGNVLLASGKTDEGKRRAADMLDMVSLGELSHRYPHELSGGQQQRVALARALATNPELLLLDEPFSSLDRVLKTAVRAEVSALIAKTGITALIVTHDVDDAIEMADRIAVMDQGRVVASGTAKELYENPRNAYTAALFGEYNILRNEENHLIGIRPEHLSPSGESGAEAQVIGCRPWLGRFKILAESAGREVVFYSAEPMEPGASIRLKAWAGAEFVIEKTDN